MVCPPRPARARRGMTLVEVMVSVFVLTLCTWMLSTTLMASARHAENKRER
ncbi:MAG: prepilin-type N-terminal cleavage/methylation domain-containing protein, partial [Planctomycetes bacterium]|nr:prepilin-type N-terminal cleavage/methylation domain-containing protein [Planctomycetota bacterium]